MPPKKKLKRPDNQGLISNLFNPVSSQTLPGPESDKQPVTESDSTQIVDRVPSSSEQSLPSTSDENFSPSSSEQSGHKAKKTRKIQDNWLKIWPWLYVQNDVLFCRICVDSKRKNVFATEGCKVYKTSSMTRHEKSEEHVASAKAPQLATGFLQAVEQAVQQSDSRQDIAMRKCISTVLWLAKENVPLAKFESMFPLYQELGVTGLEVLKLNDRVSYDSYYTALEILDSISSVIDDDINSKLTASPFITMLSDESTDLANKKRITLNARIIDPKTCVAETVFLSDKEYEDGSGLGLATVILQELDKRGQAVEKMVGFGSDGAAVMTGGNKGVKGVLMQKQPHLIHIHCMAHRLALCTSQAADGVKPIKQYQEWLTSLYYYFSKSATREQELQNIQIVLNSKALKYKEVHAVRWLSVYQAVEAVYKTIDPLLAYLHQRERAKDPKSKGLLKKMATTEFVYLTYLLMDVLSLVSKLCLTFQKQDLDVATAKLAVDSCLADLEAYKGGTQLFPTHLELYDQHIAVDDTGRHVYKNSGHILAGTPTNLAGVKSSFINAIISNIRSRFPQKDLVDAFFVLGMRGINMQSYDVAKEFGNSEVEKLAQHFGQEKIYKGTVALPKINKTDVSVQWARAKDIVRSLKYPVDKFPELWQLLALHHREELDQLITLAQIGLILPLHTADCERTFSQQNKILTKSRANLSSKHLDELIRVRLFTKSGSEVSTERVLAMWKASKNRKLYA